VIGERELSRHDAAAAITLARDVAGALNYPMDEVWWAFCNVPLNMAGLLDTPTRLRVRMAENRQSSLGTIPPRTQLLP
jgi:hypothetical protein